MKELVYVRVCAHMHAQEHLGALLGERREQREQRPGGQCAEHCWYCCRMQCIRIMPGDRGQVEAWARFWES